jgi:hypothetical protein
MTKLTTLKKGVSRIGRRKSLADWQSAPLDNQLCRDAEDAARKIGYVLDPRKYAEICIYLCGEAGLGKSEAIKRALAQLGLTGCFRRISDWRSLISAFEDAERLRQPLILEESDQVLWSRAQANILKEATDAAGRRELYIPTKGLNAATGKVEKYVKTVRLTAPLIVTSNKDLRDLNSFEKPQRPHVAALASRSAPIFLGGDRLTQWDYACYLAICHKMLHKPDERNSVSPQVQDKALRWFTTNLNRLADGSPRTLKNVCKFISYNPDDPDLWERDLRQLLRYPEAPDFEIEEDAMPRIFLSEEATARMKMKQLKRAIHFEQKLSQRRDAQALGRPLRRTVVAA